MAAELRAKLSTRLDIDSPHAVLLDLGLPDREGWSLSADRQIGRGAAASFPHAKRRQEKIAALDLGADDYVTNPSTPTKCLLVSASTAATRERRWQRESCYRRYLKSTCSHAEFGATAKTSTLLRRNTPSWPNSQASGRVLTHAQLLRAAWGPAHEQDVEYLRVIARELRKKIKVRPARPRIIKTEPAIGYRLADPTG